MGQINPCLHVLVNAVCMCVCIFAVPVNAYHIVGFVDQTMVL